MFFEKAVLDLIVPTTFFSTLFLEVIVIVIEAIVIYFLLEKSLVKAFISSTCTNFVTGVLSLFYLLFSIEPSFPLYSKVILIVIMPLLINIFIEAGILKFFYGKVTMQRILKVSVVMNLASYLFILINILPLLTS